MLKWMLKHKVLGAIVGCGLILSSTSMTVLQRANFQATASPEQSTTQIPSMPDYLTTDTKFQPIHQPLMLKVGVAFGGLALIGLELWWFLLSKPIVKPYIKRHL
jgi:hypothetical protein